MNAAARIKLDHDVIPTQDTKLLLAGTISIPPIVWGWTPQAEKDAKAAFDKAFELGLAFYDTAEVYGDGESEREICRFRNDYSEQDKEKQVIATKYFPYNHRTQFPDVLLSALKDSLARLGTFQVDLYQIHAPIHPAEIEVVANALADAYDKGLIKAVGVSNYSKDEIQRMHAALQKRGIVLASNQISFSLIRTIPEKSGLIQQCHNLGIVILAYSRKFTLIIPGTRYIYMCSTALGMGILTGKYGSQGPWPKGREQPFKKFDTAQLGNLLDVVKRLGEQYGRPPSAIALNWCMAKGTVPLGGARTQEHVEQNALALGFRLTNEQVAELDEFAFLGSNNKGWQHG
ncbi:NADP-dependent oxidoreductase domain-containing protein [Parasitella parasitica]|nr:NADP-dependent oxidoreductase domain-containing protein [Parasitella parasitica]